MSYAVTRKHHARFVQVLPDNFEEISRYFSNVVKAYKTIGEFSEIVTDEHIGYNYLKMEDGIRIAQYRLEFGDYLVREEGKQAEVLKPWEFHYKYVEEDGY